ncbi:MAG: S8 family serine peptidase [Candidatus Gracilibacteria bacterium]|nr:S8 family serine peptidase [Candidatus Gracilibacteria bacterium]
MDQEIIWLARHVSMILPQYDNEETRLNWSMLGELSSSSESLEFGDMKTIYGSRSWHLPYIGMDKLYSKGVSLKTDIGVGIIDGGLTLGHEDISSDVAYIGAKCVIDQRKVTHGSAVVGSSTGSIISNGLGVRGIIQAKTVFRDNQGTSGNFELIKKRIEDVLNHPAKPRTVNLSISLGNDTYNEAMNNNSGTGKILQFDKNKNFESVKLYRNLFASHPDVLFVIAAGNAGVSEPWDNAAVHYRYDKLSKSWIYSPLNNVIVVAANGPDNVLHNSSDFGQGVDISAPSGYMTIRYAGDGKSYYKTGELKSDYGISQTPPDFSSVVGSFVPGNFDQPSYGTSFSAPLVTGVATLLFSADPLLTPKEVKEYLTINSKVGGGLRYAGERWKVVNGIPIKELLAKPLPILDASASYDAVIANKTLIENLDVTTRDVQISIIDSNSIQDEYFNLVVNNVVIGKIENLPGSTTTYPVKLKSGDNLLELRITNTAISDTRLTMRLSPDGIEKIFQGNDISYAWTIRAP